MVMRYSIGYMMEQWVWRKMVIFCCGVCKGHYKRRTWATRFKELLLAMKKAKEEAVASGKRHTYNNAVDMLQKLLDKRDAKRMEELWSAIIKSEKTYDEIMEFITANHTIEEA